MAIGSIFILVIVGSAYTCGTLCNVYFYNEHGMSAIQYVTDGTDFIIPTYIVEVFRSITFGDMFVSLFLVSLICASISTISGLMHTIGAAGGYDVYSSVKMWKHHTDKDESSVNINRIVTMVMMVVVVIYCYLMPSDIIAKATSVFMGLTAAALLPAYVHAIYSKNPCRPAAIISIAAGTVSYLFWALFINSGTSIFLPVCKLLTGDKVLFDGLIQYVDALVISLPLSIVVMAVSLFVIRSKARSAQVQDVQEKTAVAE
jgi:SSS family solute:Na+ symporter